jgi:hypothetical protein
MDQRRIQEDREEEEVGDNFLTTQHLAMRLDAHSNIRLSKTPPAWTNAEFRKIVRRRRLETTSSQLNTWQCVWTHIAPP